MNAALGVGIWGLATMVLLVSAGLSLWRRGRDRTTLATWLSGVPTAGSADAGRDLATPRLARDSRPRVR